MPRRGESVLTPEARQAAAARYQAGETAAAIAAGLGVSETTLRIALRAARVLRNRAAAQALRGQ